MYSLVSLKALFRKLRRICTGRKVTGTVKVLKSSKVKARANAPLHTPKPTTTRFSATIINALTRSENERGVFRVTSVFSDFYDKTVIIAEYEIDDYTGKTEKTVLSEIKADVQPYSGGRAREQYGLDIECQMRMFCDMSDDVKVGNRVEYDGDIYDITYVQKWDSGLVAMLERSRLK